MTSLTFLPPSSFSHIYIARFYINQYYWWVAVIWLADVGHMTTEYSKCFDPSMSCNDLQHLKITTPATVAIIVFSILPTLLLVLYPIRSFRTCLLKCTLDGIVITVFVDKFYSCYRNGLEGGRDMRSFSGLY